MSFAPAPNPRRVAHRDDVEAARVSVLTGGGSGPTVKATQERPMGGCARRCCGRPGVGRSGPGFTSREPREAMIQAVPVLAGGG